MSECPRRRKAGILFKNSFDFGIFPDFVPRFYVLYQLARIVLQSCNMSCIFNICCRIMMPEMDNIWTSKMRRNFSEITNDILFSTSHKLDPVGLAAGLFAVMLIIFVWGASLVLLYIYHMFILWRLFAIWYFWVLKYREYNFQHQKTNEKGIFIESRIIPA